MYLFYFSTDSVTDTHGYSPHQLFSGFVFINYIRLDPMKTPPLTLLLLLCDIEKKVCSFQVSMPTEVRALKVTLDYLTK